MHHGRRSSRFPASRFTTREFDAHSEPSVHESRYRHVLVSTSLNIADRAALLLGFELASLHQSALTLLHVLPRPEPARMAVGLDAIGLLHSAADEFRRTSAAAKPSEVARPRLRQFVEDLIPPGLLDAVCWRGECRPGNVTDAVVSYVDESAADMVILSASSFRWWLPIVPFAVWNIERRARANVVLIGGQAPSPLS